MTNPAAAHSAKVLEFYPTIASTALFMKHVVGNVELAATNGTEVLFGPLFFTMQDSEKNGVVLHEYLHCVLCHPQRAALVRIEEGEKFNLRAFNIAADSLINFAIAQENRGTVITLPDGLVDFYALKDDFKTLGFSVDNFEPANVSVEEIYRMLMSVDEMSCPSADDNNKHAEGGAGEKKGSQPGEGGADQDGKDQGQEKTTKEKKAWERIRDMIKRPSDLNVHEGSIEDVKEAMREQIARNNANNLGYGSKTANILERISGDIPKEKVAWQSAFRTLTTKYLSRERIRNNRRPSNSMLSHEAMGGAMFWEAGRMRTPQPRALIIADTSGSVSMESYVQFLGELQGMKRRTNAMLFFGQADTELKEIVEIKDVKTIKDLHIKKRGGTSFVQPLAFAEEAGFDVVIYMTDLDGEFPPKCTIPVIWVSLNSNKTPPFGRHFRID